jgi:hypothetical protein
MGHIFEGCSSLSEIEMSDDMKKKGWFSEELSKELKKKSRFKSKKLILYFIFIYFFYLFIKYFKLYI